MINQEQIFGVVAAGAALTAMTTDTANADPMAFAGPYVGLSFGALAGTVGDDYDYAVGDQMLGSLFGGYNWVNSNGLIYGAEVAIWTNDTYFGGGSADYGIEGMVDVRARVGMSLTDTSMLYGAAGVWQADYLFDDDNDGGMAQGFSLGVGYETILNNGMFIGADVTMRSTTSVDLNDPTGDDKSPDTLTTASLRFGFRF